MNNNQNQNNNQIYSQNQLNNFNQAIINYQINENKKDRKNNIIGFLLFLISCINLFVLRNKVTNYINDFCLKNETLKDKASLITTIYLIISIIFFLVTLWNLVKYRGILRKIYIIGLILAIGYFGRDYYYMYKNSNEVKTMQAQHILTDSRELCRIALEQWKSDIISGGTRQIEYRKSNGEVCNNKILIVVDRNTDYSIVVNSSGKITNFNITNGFLQYSYSGSGLEFDNINSDMFVRVDESNKIVVPKCNQ